MFARLVTLFNSYLSTAGSRSTFMNAAHELEDIVSTTRLLVTRLRADRARRRRDVSAFELDDYGETVVSLEYTVLRLVS